MRKLLLSILVISLILIAPLSVQANGPGLILSASRTSVERGNEVTIYIEVNNVPSLVCYGPIEISYNSAIFNFVSASQSKATGDFKFENNTSESVVSITMYNGLVDVSGQTRIVSIKFKSKADDTGEFGIKRAEGFAGDDLVPIGMPTSSKVSVTVNPPVQRSSDNTLKSLTISRGTLTPAFSSGQRNYTAVVDTDVSQLLVSAAATDSKAQNVSGGGTISLDEGENTIQLTVTAEDGSKRTYTIVVTRTVPTPSPSPSPTPAVTVPGPGGTFSVAELPEDVSVPTGFYSTVETLNGQSVPASKSLRGDLTLFYLVQEEGPSGFYYFNSSTDEYLPFLTVSLPALTMPILLPDSDVEIPQGFVETSLVVDGQAVKAWQREGETQNGEYLVYLMNADGTKAFYIYGTTSRFLIPYSAIEAAPTETMAPVETTPEPTETTEEPVPEPDTGGVASWQLIALLLGLFSLILLGLVIWLVFRLRKDDSGQKPQKPQIKRVT